jgi:hypothetical protein
MPTADHCSLDVVFLGALTLTILYGHRSSSFVTAGTRTHGYCSKILPLLVGGVVQERRCRSRLELAYSDVVRNVARRRIGITTQALLRILLR